MTELRKRIDQLINVYEEYGLSHLELLNDIMAEVAKYVEENTTPATRGKPLEQIDTRGVHYPR